MASEIEFNLVAPATEVQRGEARAPTEVGQAGGFSRDLSNAINSIDKLHREADLQADAVARGAGNLHEVALAFEKADVALRLAGRVRNKLVDAYNEIMRMSV